MDNWDVFPKEALVVAMMAQRHGLARLERSEEDICRHASDIIARSRDLTRWMMDKGFIAEAPADR